MKKSLLLAVLACGYLASCSENANETTEKDLTKSTIPVLEVLWETDTTLIGNESVIYDVTSDAIYVSCMGEMPDDALDGDGFIAKLNLDGTIENLHWVSGLNCPKGMAISDGKLLVTDIGQLISIDLETGTVLSSETIEGGAFLNDVDVAPNGDIFLTESRLNHILRLRNGKTELYYSTEDIGGLNGVHVVENGLYFTGEDNIQYLDNEKNAVAVSDSTFGADGIEKYKDGYFASSWQGKIYWFTDPQNSHKLIDTWDVEQYSADIDVIEEKALLVSPTLFNNKVIAYRIK